MDVIIENSNMYFRIKEIFYGITDMLKHYSLFYAFDQLPRPFQAKISIKSDHECENFFAHEQMVPT